METYHAVPFIKTCRHELLRYPYQCSPDLLLTNTPKGLASEKRHLELETETLLLINWDREANCIDRLLSLILFLFGGTILSILVIGVYQLPRSRGQESARVCSLSIMILKAQKGSCPSRCATLKMVRLLFLHILLVSQFLPGRSIDPLPCKGHRV